MFNLILIEMKKKVILWGALGLIILTAILFFTAPLREANGVGDQGNYQVTATVQAEGTGSVSFGVADLLSGNFQIDGKTGDTIIVVVPASVAKQLHERHTSGALEDVRGITGTGNIKGELKVVVSTPFGELTVLDRPFAYERAPKE
jgi:prephenate dehydrogenase